MLQSLLCQYFITAKLVPYQAMTRGHNIYRHTHDAWKKKKKSARKGKELGPHPDYKNGSQGSQINTCLLDSDILDESPSSM